ncbi:hypothetical protein AMATHDRAFT_137706 [Amanita thiersii Skay4041]|uniref:Uncharacterized protein n=1 Tax=Amanita thiersii Skay4041 TaxID=703135 RepID=A0A2A9NTI1_9AGAR|nr:hypothetical protein AMATHDRAFT_137706 [Amanita thiersii Skay4041]
MHIDTLPVELVSRIFQKGVEHDHTSPFLLRPHHRQPITPQLPSLNYQLLVSHVCARWRAIALRTPSLWSLLIFCEAPHIDRARTLLSRIFPNGPLSGSAPPSRVPPSRTLTILISTVASDSHVPGVTLSQPELHTILYMLRSYLPAWRALHLVVRDNLCKLVAREHLGNCGPAPLLETLQLYHFEDFRGAQDLYLATYRPPVVVFANSLPKLRNISLIGVNLPWERSPYLYEGRLKRLELALHADSIRPPYEFWERMLRGCNTCGLEELALHYSGPRVGEGEAKYVWTGADDRTGSPDKGWRKKIWLSRLERLSLTDLDPDYLCKIMERLVLPAVKKLELDLPDQDFTGFVEMLAIERPYTEVATGTADDSLASPVSSSSDFTTLSSGLSPSPSSPSSPRSRMDVDMPTFPALSQLEHLTITALECSVDSWRSLFKALASLKVLEIDFARVRDEFWNVLMEYDAQRTRSSREADPLKTPTLFPLLHTFRLCGVDGRKVVEMIRWRSKTPVGRVRKWIVKWSDRVRGRDRVLDEVMSHGVWVDTVTNDGSKFGWKVDVDCWDDEDEEEDEDEDEDEGEDEEEEEEEEEEAEGEQVAEEQQETVGDVYDVEGDEE